jgi:hypothetical protein
MIRNTLLIILLVTNVVALLDLIKLRGERTNYLNAKPEIIKTLEWENNALALDIGRIPQRHEDGTEYEEGTEEDKRAEEQARDIFYRMMKIQNTIGLIYGQQPRFIKFGWREKEDDDTTTNKYLIYPHFSDH